MKKLGLNLMKALILCCLINPQLASAATVGSAQALAKSIVRKAHSNASVSGLRSLYSSIYTKVSNPILLPAKGKDFELCRGAMVAYTVPRLSPYIYLCARSLYFDELGVAQTLIHEAAHLAGYINECDATRIERAAMRSAGYTPYTNDYVTPCGLD